MNTVVGLVTASASVLVLSAMPLAATAQGTQADEAVEEIVTIGTRRQGRTAVDTAVPIDVFSQEDLDSVSSDDMLDIVNKLVPSFQVGRLPLNDGASFIRPPTLRGLDSDKTLVLVNGKRRHRAALVRLGGFGSHGPDLATIPSIAVRSVEVLRDGAAAQYGSDAIAGVMNFNLKNDAEGGEVRLQVGQFTEDEEAIEYLAALNFGFALGANGFVNTSVELSDAQPTSRGLPYEITIEGSGLTPAQSALVQGQFDVLDTNGDVLFPQQQRFGPDALIEVWSPTGQLLRLEDGSDGIPDDTDTRYRDNICFAEVGQGSCLTQIWGTPDRDAIRAFVNAGLDLNQSTQLYAWANYSDSNSNTGFFHRRPGVSQLLVLRRQDGSLYNPRDRYPGGFTPRFFGTVIDYSGTGGIQGEWDNGLSYDFSARFGHDEINYEIRNTLNPSMGPASPTAFRPGTLVNEETEVNADFVKVVDVGWANDLNVAFGLAYRDESYDIEQGGAASFQIGPYASPDPWNFDVTPEEALLPGETRAAGCYIPGQETVGTQCAPGDPIFNAVPVGSNGFPGFGPNFTTQYDRDSYAVYVDLESDITDNFLGNVAFRYEDYSDFGDNFSWKAAGRYRFSDAFSLRGSVGTGFRAPTGGQISTVNVSTRIADDGTPVAEGVFPPASPVAGIFGALPLDAETSEQATLGFTTTPTDNLTVTVDYYFIKLEDRIVLSSDFDVGPAEVAQLEALGVPGANTIAQVSFFANDVESETQGVDLVVNYNWDWAAGNTALQFAGNWNDTDITDPGQFLGPEDVFDEENDLPNIRANVTARHTWDNNITFALRANYYGESENVGDDDFDPPPEVFGAITQFDADLTWDINDIYRVTIGGNNIFDELPDTADGSDFCCGQVFRTSDPADWMGPFWYIRGSIVWD